MTRRAYVRTNTSCLISPNVDRFVLVFITPSYMTGLGLPEQVSLRIHSRKLRYWKGVDPEVHFFVLQDSTEAVLRSPPTTHNQYIHNIYHWVAFPYKFKERKL